MSALRPDTTLSATGETCDQLQLPMVEGRELVAETFLTVKWTSHRVQMQCQKCRQIFPSIFYDTEPNGSRICRPGALAFDYLLEHVRAHQVRDKEAGR